MDELMANRLSYSQVRLFSECGQKYKYYYKDKLREKVKSGALFFGTAFDKATGAVLEDRSIDEVAVFDKSWQRQEINGKEYDLPECTRVVYSASDFDADLLLPDDIKFLLAKRDELCPDLLGDVETFCKELAKFKKQRPFRVFKEVENRLYNLCNWMSLRRKGHLMLAANRTKVLPRIQAVEGTQVKVELGNGEGDSLLGYVDAVVTWEDGQRTIFDYKTSSSYYDENAVLTSPQLTIYAHSMNIPRAGYFVFQKNVLKNRIKFCSVCNFDGTGSRAKSCTSEETGKRCGGAWNETIKPEIDVQIMVDTIPERTEEIVLENIEVTNRAIRNEIYARNFNSCKTGYGYCPYIGLCFRNDKTDLEQV